MLQAIIFDCDGVIADTEPLHFATFQSVLADESISLTEQAYYSEYLALDDRGCFNRIFRDAGKLLDEQLLRSLILKKAARIEPMMRDHLKIFPGVVEFIRKAAEVFPLAVASGALRHEVELILRHAGVRDCFQAVVAAEDVTRGKPDPEPFLKALAEINRFRASAVPSADSLVVEDSIHGVHAAHEAGMRCLAVTNSYPGEKLSRADAVVASMEDVELAMLEELFGKR
jgi:HAD superfamily hydrolase (TIGR01509 family)